MNTIGRGYAEFLSELLRVAGDVGPHDAALLRQMELGTQRLLLEPARAFESEAPAEEIERQRCATRDILRPIWARGAFGYEITNWPSGPGSARAMELVYGNAIPSFDVPTHYTEWFLLTRDLAHAVRSRRDVLRRLLLQELNGRVGDQSVLDLACGPCQSLREALPLLRDRNRIRLRAVDKDELAQTKNRGFFCADHRLSWDFEVGNVLKIDLGDEEHDVVYSTGLYDYLQSPTLVTLWRGVYASLKPGGVAILTVKDGDRFCPSFYRWAIDWSQFLIRRQAEFEKLMLQADLPAPERTVRDASGCILFYLVRKPG
jgi:SAM-dependent methyltransferase